MSFRIQEILQQAENSATGESSISYSERIFSDGAGAGEVFIKLKGNLLDLSHWNHKSDLSSYRLFDSNGQTRGDQTIKLDAFIKITLAGSGKSDWVRVADIYNVENELVITVSPTYDPTAEPKQTGKTSHFFWNKSTNNFCAFREAERISLYVIGLNEKLNSDHTSGLVETVRNTAVAELGYYLGIQKAEWTKFCKSFLFDDEEQAAG